MPVRTALQALGMRPGAFLRSSWPWRSLAYLLSSAVLGGVTIVALTGLLFAGLLLAFVVVGVLTPAAVVLAGTVVARMERRRLRLVDSYPVEIPHREPATGRWRWLTARLRESLTWREFGYMAVSVTALWWIDAAVVAVALYVPPILIFGPLYHDTAPLSLTLTGTVAGLFTVVVAAYSLTAWAGARAAMTRAVLTPVDEAQEKLVAVSRSRARLVDAFEVERRRIERDLHDGAQQRLVAMTVQLGIARLELAPDSRAAGPVAEAHEHAKLALAELRELIRGVHPKILTDRGLVAAVRDVASRSPVPVDVHGEVGRLDPAVETTGYFVVVEALANVAKHAAARKAEVRLAADGGRLVLVVLDDGAGGADPAKGTGLTGLADRVAAVDGFVTLRSPPGGPTVLRVEIPCTRSG